MLGSLFLNPRVSILGIQPYPTPAGLRHRASPSSPSCRVRIREGCDLFTVLQPGLELRSSASPARVPSLPLCFSSSGGAASVSPPLGSVSSSLLHNLTLHTPCTVCSPGATPSSAPATQFYLLSQLVVLLSPPPRIHSSALYPCNSDSAV